MVAIIIAPLISGAVKLLKKHARKIEHFVAENASALLDCLLVSRHLIDIVLDSIPKDYKKNLISLISLSYLKMAFLLSLETRLKFVRFVHLFLILYRAIYKNKKCFLIESFH